MKGRKPIPTELHKLHGNPSKKDLPENEPKPAPAYPKCPSILSGPGRREYHRVAGELFTLGLLTSIDLSALTAYCIAYGQMIEAERELKAIRRAYLDAKKKNAYETLLILGMPNGMTRKTANGNAIMEPLLSVRKQAMEQMHKFLTEFGMSPASRTRLSAGKKEESDPMEELLNYGQRAN